jgi:hypothetical protein
MDRGNGSDIAEGKDILVFVYYCGWDLTADEFVENGLVTHSRYEYRA